MYYFLTYGAPCSTAISDGEDASDRELATGHSYWGTEKTVESCINATPAFHALCRDHVVGTPNEVTIANVLEKSVDTEAFKWVSHTCATTSESNCTVNYSSRSGFPPVDAGV